MTVETKNLSREELRRMWADILQKGGRAKASLDALDTAQMRRLVNSEPLPAMAAGSVLAALRTIATLAKGAGDTTTLQAIANALEAAEALPTNEVINGSRQQSFFSFTPSLQKMFENLIVFCRE